MDSAVSPQDVRTSPKPTRTTDEETETNSAASAERVVSINRKVVASAEAMENQKRCLMDWNDIVHDRSGSSPEVNKQQEAPKYGRRRRTRRFNREEELLSEDGGIEQAWKEDEDSEQKPLRIVETPEINAVDVAVSKLRIDADATKRPSPDGERETNFSSSKKLEERTGRPTQRRQRLYEADSIDKNPWPHDNFEALNREIEEEEGRFSKKMYSDRKEELARQTRTRENWSIRGGARQMDDDRADVQRRPYLRAAFSRRAARPAARTGSMRARPDYVHPRYYEEERPFGNRNRRDYPTRNNEGYRREQQFDDRRYNMEQRRAPTKNSFRGGRRDYYSRPAERTNEFEVDDDWSYKQDRPSQSGGGYGRQSTRQKTADRVKSISDRSDESYDRMMRGRPSPSDDLLGHLPSIPQTNMRVYNKQADGQQFVRYSYNRRRSADLRENGGRRFSRDSKPSRYPIAPRYERAAERQQAKSESNETRRERAATDTPDKNVLIVGGSVELARRSPMSAEKASAPSSLSPYASPFKRENEIITVQQSDSVLAPPASQTVIPFGSEVTLGVPSRGTTLVFPQQHTGQAIQACFQPNGSFSLTPTPPGSQLFGSNSAASPYICYTSQQIPAAFPSVSTADMQQAQLAVSALQPHPYQLTPNHVPVELFQNPAQYISPFQRSAFVQQPQAPFNPAAFQPVYGVDYFNHVAAMGANEYTLTALTAAQAANQRASQQPSLANFALPAQAQNLQGLPMSQSNNNTFEQRLDGSNSHPQFIP